MSARQTLLKRRKKRKESDNPIAAYILDEILLKVQYEKDSNSSFLLHEKKITEELRRELGYAPQNAPQKREISVLGIPSFAIRHLNQTRIC